MTTSRGLRTGSFGISADRHRLSADKFSLQGGLAVLEEHLDHFPQIVLEFIESGSLGMGAVKPGT